MKFAIYSRLLKTSDVAYIKVLFDVLEKKGHQIVVFESYLEELAGKVAFNWSVDSFSNNLDLSTQGVDFLISLGGDGTILDTPALVRGTNIPIVGVNLGRLGFLASIEKENIEFAIQCIEEGAYTLEERTLLKLTSSSGLFGDNNFALNDCTVSKRDTSSMIIVHSYIDGKFLNSYWADGVIVSTPTGSTGYSLSCGGPIISPTTSNFVVTPVAPHNLNVRPIIVSDDSELRFEIEGRANNFLCTLDSRLEVLQRGATVTIKKNDFGIQLVKLQNKDFYDTIRKKLAWGVDSRNFKS